MCWTFARILAQQTDPWTGPAKWALGLGLAGTLLGLGNLIWNWIQYHWRTRVVLKVQPAFARIESGLLVFTPNKVLQDGFIITTIINESHFPVTIARVSIQLEGSNLSYQPTEYRTEPPGPWPRRLDRKEAIKVLLREVSFTQLLTFGARAVEVETVDGSIAVGTCTALQALHCQYQSLPKNELGIASLDAF